MGLAQRYTRPRTTPPGIGGGGRRLTRAVQFLTEANNPFVSVERVPRTKSFTSWAEVVRYTQQIRPRTVYRGQRVKVIENAKRIVAIGDVHGDADGLRAHLQEAGVIDQNGKLSPNLEEGTQIVFMGDYLDRGPTSMQVLDMVRDLQAQGTKMGVQVHAIMGNHEALFLRFFEIYSRKTQAEVEAAIADTGHKSKTTQRDGTDLKII